MTQASDDALSELLIAQLLEEDLRLLAQAQIAERFQVTQALSDTAPHLEEPRKNRGRAAKRRPSSPIRDHVNEVQADSDVQVALQLTAAEARLGGDVAFAQELKRLQDTTLLDQQAAQKWAATEVKLMLDAEFARKLQEMEDEDEEDSDDLDELDVEKVLGKDAIDHIMARDLNNKGKAKPEVESKGKGKGQSRGSHASAKGIPPSPSPFKKCGICMDPFQATHSPISASQSANSSARLPFGLHLPCPNSHAYCLECIASHINSKLDPTGSGQGDPGAVVFPIRCPECDANEWPGGIPDDVAVKVLDGKAMDLWHHQKLLDSTPKYYCPNPKCSVLLQLDDDDDDDPQAICPSCDVLLCIPCRVLWHRDLTCEDFQALPLDERSPEDQQALQLMRAENWRRCPKCAIIVELTVGCNHITCRCGTHFCFKCGSLWDKTNSKCTRKPSCELWDEEMLLEERERGRQANQAPPVGNNPAPAARPPPVVRHQPIVEPHRPPTPPTPPLRARIQTETDPIFPGDLEQWEALDRFEWMLIDGGVKSGRHPFTRNMVGDLTCQYCFASLNSLADLRFHLSRTNKHPVYACCGRFFKRASDLRKHLDAGWNHENQVIRVTDDDDLEGL